MYLRKSRQMVLFKTWGGRYLVEYISSGGEGKVEIRQVRSIWVHITQVDADGYPAGIDCGCLRGVEGR